MENIADSNNCDRAESKRTKNLSIGYAINWMKEGRKVSREGWNGKGMYLYMVNEISLYQAYISMKTVQGTSVPWVASQADLLATDWYVVE